MQDVLLTRCFESAFGGSGRSAVNEETCCLVCIHPPQQLGQVMELEARELTIGRDADSDLELPDDSVSRRHALLRPGCGGFTVIDLGSTNGTYVNDVRVEMQQLQPRDRLRFGNQIFRFLAADRFEAEYFEAVYRMMTTDGLTQACNKRYLLDFLERELRRAARTKHPLSALMLDVDHFKSINDSYGHLAGDEVLIELSSRLRSTLRNDEVLARYGGEEFCLILPETSREAALAAAERARAAVAAQPFSTEHARIEVTISVGVACQADVVLTAPADLLCQADQQLYAAKRAGRNRVAG